MIDLSRAVVYDVEVLPNVFTLHMEELHSEMSSTWELSEFRDDRAALMAWFNYLHDNQIPMIGFNNVGYDYIIIHFIYMNPQCTCADIYAKNQQIFASQPNNRFELMIWERDRFAPQIDLFKINHFDNRAKTTSLKALQINMRSPSVVDSPVEFGTHLTVEQVERDLIPYNKHDVKETKRFAHICTTAIEFRAGLIDTLGTVEVLNYNDTKIGAKILEQRLGEEICYDRSSGRKAPRQTPRRSIALRDIIFPYVSFQHPEFARVLDYMRAQVLTPDDIDDPVSTIKTKGVFSNVQANVGGLDFHFGTGGIHGSVPPQRIIATDEWLIRDIDVEGLYPRIGIVNRLAPAHLGDAFVAEYSRLPAERKQHAKGTVQNASLKLAANGTYGNTNNKFSVFYDPLYTMQITINGQLMLCMLAERLVTVPTVQLVQINTDGITYRIHASYLEQAKAVEQAWSDFTMLVLEDASYSRMWIRDVNNYIAETDKGKLKQKGAYWHPASGDDYARSIAENSPPAWHKDLGNVVSIRAAVAAMVHGIEPATFIRLHTDPFDFMCRARAQRTDTLLLDGRAVQKTCRYYVAREGGTLNKVAPPAGPEGMYKRRNGVTEAEYQRVMAANGWQWDAAVCTGNKSKYEQRITGIEAGWKVALCNDASHFRFDNIDYSYYENEAKKLIIL